MSTNFLTTRWKYLLIYMASWLQPEVYQINSSFSRRTMFFAHDTQTQDMTLNKCPSKLESCFSVLHIKPTSSKKTKTNKMNRTFKHLLRKTTNGNTIGKWLNTGMNKLNILNISSKVKSLEVCACMYMLYLNLNIFVYIFREERVI